MVSFVNCRAVVYSTYFYLISIRSYNGRDCQGVGMDKNCAHLVFSKNCNMPGWGLSFLVIELNMPIIYALREGVVMQQPCYLLIYGVHMFSSGKLTGSTVHLSPILSVPYLMQEA